MNGLRKLPDSEQTSLHALFPRLAELNDYRAEHGYQQLALSIFDHQLDRNEGELLLDNVSSAEQERRNRSLQTFIYALLEETAVVTFRYRSADAEDIELDFYELLSAEQARKYFSHTGEQRYIAVIPDSRAICYEGYDDTNYLFFLDRSLVEQIIELGKKAGLHVW